MARPHYTIADMTLRALAASFVATVGLAAAAPTASATDFFATTDNTATSQNCLTEATACALGKAMDVVPAVAGGEQPGVGHTLTLLPGTYDPVDFDAGASSTRFGRLSVTRGLTMQGKPGAPAPTIDVSTSPTGSEAIRMTIGGVLRHLRILRNSNGLTVSVAGFAAAFGDPGATSTLDRVHITASAPGTTGFSNALDLQGFAIVKNSLVEQEGGDPTQTSAVATFSTSVDGAPQVVGSTLLSATGAAFAASGSTIGSPAATHLTNTALRGAPDLDVSAQAGSPVTVSLTNSAWRNAAPFTVVAGPATIDAKTPPVTGDLKLDGGGKPLEGSPLIDAGAALTDLGPLDLDGNARVSGSAPDIGAFEVTASTPPPITAQCGCLPPANPPTPGPAPDTTAPTASTLKPPKTLKRSKLTKGKGVSLTATVSEALASAKVELVQITKKTGKAPKEKVLATATLGAGGPSLKFPLKVKASKLAKKGKQKLTLRYTFVDAAGNKTVVDKAVTVS